MGNPEKKTNLGRGMTGGHGALPYFNAFMSQFMKGKEKESFPKAPPIPSDIKALAEQRRREELEKLEKADEEGRSTGVIFNTGTRTRSNNTTTSDSTTSTEVPVSTDTPIAPPPEIKITPSREEPPKPPAKPVTTTPPIKKPEPPPAEKPKDEGTKRKGKKGEG